MQNNQYQHSGPPPLPRNAPDPDASKIVALEETVKLQTKEIELLKRELRRLGTRLDRASSVVNKINNR